MLPTLLLTAGVGSRLDPLTRLVAKPAVPVAGRTLVERALDWLRREDVTDVVLNLHHRPETITAVVGDGAHLGLRVRYSWEQPLLGSAGGPRHALPLLGTDTFLIVNGDTLCDFPLAPMIAAHHARGADVTMGLIANPAPGHYNSVMMNGDRRVRGFVAKGSATPPALAAATDGARWHFIGVQVVRASLFAPLADGVPAETVAALYREGVAAQTIKVFGYPAATTFVDVGTPGDYLATAVRLSGDPAGRVVEAGADVDASSHVTRTIVWPGARVGARAALEECVVTGGVTVPPGFAAKRTIVMPASLARATDRVDVRGDLALFPLGG